MNRRLVPMPPSPPDVPAPVVKVLILFIAATVLLVRGWIWLSVRFTLTMMVITRLIAALPGGRRRR